MIRVLIVHNRSVLSRGLRMLLSTEPDIYVVGEATGEVQAADMAGELGADVALVDADVLPARGLATVRAISASCPQVRVILLSLEDDPETRASAVQAGAIALVSKRTPTEVLAAIRATGG